MLTISYRLDNRVCEYRWLWSGMEFTPSIGLKKPDSYNQSRKRSLTSYTCTLAIYSYLSNQRDRSVPVVTYSILSTRAILNIRSMSEREYGTSDATELHTVNHRQDTHIPLAFRNPDASRNSVSDIEWVDRPAGM